MFWTLEDDNGLSSLFSFKFITVTLYMAYVVEVLYQTEIWHNFVYMLGGF